MIMEGEKRFMKLNQLDTEKVNEKSLQIDQMNTIGILETINQEDCLVPLAIQKSIPSIASAVDSIYEQIKKGGRLIYIGAGTSGRLGVLDASECPPTYGVDSTLVQGLIAGGPIALTTAVEGAEDHREYAVEDLKKILLNKNDVVCGIAASGRTPYVIGGLEYANQLGCQTVSLCCVSHGEISSYARFPIEVVVGPEVVTGSTRMKAGTAQKLVLNMLSTATMIKIGKVYKNLTVDVQPTNEKLKIRAVNIVKSAIEVEEEIAKELLAKTNYNVKVAILMGLTHMSEEECLKALNNHEGNISKTVRDIKGV